MNHSSVKTIESKVLPGVRFVIKKMAKRRADELDAQQAAFREKLRPLYEEFTPLDKERAAAVEAKTEFPEEKLKRWAELLGEISKIDRDEMAPIAMRVCLVRIEDLEITYPDAEGKDVTVPATLDLITQHGAGTEDDPDALYQEILTAIKRECGLLPEERENLPSPSTSAAAADGKQDSAVLVEMPEKITSSAA